MNFNKTTKGSNTETTINVEGYKTFVDRKDRSLFLQGISFKPRSSYYQTDKDRLKNLETTFDAVFKKEPEFALALIHFMGKEMGLRLSPTLLTTRSAVKNKLSFDDQIKIKTIVTDIFTNPKFIANSLGYVKYINSSKSFMIAPDYFLGFLRDSAENFKEHTWLKNLMKRKELKARDIIKALRVRPYGSKMEELFRQIIKNRASLKVETDDKGNVTKATELTSVLSSKNIGDDKKEEFMSGNLSKLPINQVIRNLTKLSSNDAPTLEKRLNNIFNSGDGLRFINPFDMVMIEGEYSGGGWGGKGNLTLDINKPIERVLDRVLEQNILFDIDAKNPLIVFDISGSMYPGGWSSGLECGLRNGVKFLSLILPHLENYNFYGFGNRVHNLTHEIKDSLDVMGPNKIAQNLLKYFVHKAFSEGTSLMKCTKEILEKNPNADALIIVTDEATWNEDSGIKSFNNLLPTQLKGKTFMINVDPNGQSVFKPSAEITRVSGLDGKILTMIKAILNFDQFKEDIIDNFNERLTK